MNPNSTAMMNGKFLLFSTVALPGCDSFFVLPSSDSCSAWSDASDCGRAANGESCMVSSTI